MTSSPGDQPRVADTSSKAHTFPPTSSHTHRTLKYSPISGLRARGPQCPCNVPRHLPDRPPVAVSLSFKTSRQDAVHAMWTPPIAHPSPTGRSRRLPLAARPCHCTHVLQVHPSDWPCRPRRIHATHLDAFPFISPIRTPVGDPRGPPAAGRHPPQRVA